MELLSSISDLDLIARFRDVLLEERELLVTELCLIAELDRRSLFFDYPSLWAYLVHEHAMEEWNAERKIRAARLLRRFPEIRQQLESGKLNLSLLEMTSRLSSKEKLSDAAVTEILCSISGMSCRKARREIASRYPNNASDYPDRVTPISGDLSEVRFVAPQELLEKLDAIKASLAHSHPGMKIAELIEVLATDYQQRHDRKLKAESRMKESGIQSMLIPNDDEGQSSSDPAVVPVTSQVVVTERSRGKTLSIRPGARPGGNFARAPRRALLRKLADKTGRKCSYVDPVTKRHCASTYALEVDHITPWSKGGLTEMNNLRFLCRNHHRRVTFLEFGDGKKFMRRRKKA